MKQPDKAEEEFFQSRTGDSPDQQRADSEIGGHNRGFHGKTPTAIHEVAGRHTAGGENKGNAADEQPDRGIDIAPTLGGEEGIIAVGIAVKIKAVDLE